MFDQRSRYSALEDATLKMPSGHSVTYKRRRFLPQGEKMPELREVTVAITDRLDNIAAQTLTDPLQFWQICDANNCMNPFNLTGNEAVGSVLRIPIPQFQVGS